METEAIDRVTAELLADAARDCATQDIGFYATGAPKQRVLVRLPERPCGDVLDRLGVPLKATKGVPEFDAYLADINEHGIIAPAAMPVLEKARKAIGFDPTGYIVERMIYNLLHSTYRWNPLLTQKYDKLVDVIWLHLVTKRIGDSQFRSDVTNMIVATKNALFTPRRGGVPSADALRVAVGGAIARLLVPKFGSSASPSAAERRMAARRIARAYGVLHVLSDADIDTIANIEPGDKQSSVLPLVSRSVVSSIPNLPVQIDATEEDIISATDHMLRQIIELNPTTMLSVAPPGVATSAMAQDFPLLALPLTWRTPSNACVFPSLALSSFFNDISNTAVALLKELAGASGASSITVERCASTLFIAPAAIKKDLSPLPASSPQSSPDRRWFTAIVNLSDEPITLVIPTDSGSMERTFAVGKMVATARPAKWHIKPSSSATRARNGAQIVYMCVTIAISAGANTDDAFGVAMEKARSMPAIASHIFHVAQTINGDDDNTFTGYATKCCALYARESALVDRDNGLKLLAMQMMQRRELEYEYGQLYAILKPTQEVNARAGMIVETTPKKPLDIRESRYFEQYDRDFTCPASHDELEGVRKELADAVDKRREDGTNYTVAPVVLVYPKYMPSPVNYVGLLPDAERFRHLVRPQSK